MAGGSPTESPISRCAIAKRVTESIIKLTCLPWSRKYSAIAVATNDDGSAVYDIVGPVCETGDTLARGRTLPRRQADDLVAILTAGAYGATMASEYNARALVPEVLVDGENWDMIRRRPSLESFMDREPMAHWLTQTKS